jgi:hypothetical protein
MWMGALALLAAGPVLAAEPVLTTIEFGAELWGLNGDSVRQPMVPLVQKAAVPTPVLTDTVSVTPNAGGVTQVSNFPADFAGGTTITVSKTTGGATLLLANPTNRFDPFTAILTNVVHNEAGTARFHAGPNNWTAEVAVSLTTNICLDKVDTGGFCFFVANIDLPGAVGVTGGNKTFTGHVAQLSIPISGTLFGDKWTTGQKTVMKQIITARKNGDPAGTPTGFQTFTFTSTGSASSMQLTFITPIVVDSFAGTGPNKVPIPIIGFARAVNSGATYVTPEPGALLLAAGAAALAVLGRRRLTKA